MVTEKSAHEERLRAREAPNSTGHFSLGYYLLGQLQPVKKAPPTGRCLIDDHNFKKMPSASFQFWRSPDHKAVVKCVVSVL
jgi:hypothetical protein